MDGADRCRRRGRLRRPELLVRAGAYYNMEDMLVAFASMSLIVASSRPRSLPHRFFSLRPLVVTGAFAYSIYLVHAPLLALVDRYVTGHIASPPLRFWCMAAACVPLVIFLSYLFFLAFERPFLSRRSLQKTALPAAETTVGAPVATTAL